MTSDLLLLIAQILVSAAWGLCHLRILLRTVTKPRVHIALRVLAIVPPATPVVGFLAGQRPFAVVWFALAATYVALRMQA